MPDRTSLITTFWLTSSLALLASLLVAPIQTSGFVNVSISVQSDGLFDGFALPPGQPTTYVSASMALDDVLQMNAIASEDSKDDEQDRADRLDDPRDSILIPCSFRKVTDRQLIVPRSIFSLYPLRC